MSQSEYNRKLTPKRHFYEAFPFLLFFRIMHDESLLEEYDISVEDWKAIKDKWAVRNEDWATDVYAKAQRDEIYHRSRYNKLLFLKERATWSQEGLEEIYKKIRLKWYPDKDRRDKELVKDIAKAKKHQEIFQGQKSDLEQKKIEDLERNPQEQMTEEMAQQCIASLELAGASIPDYEKLTLGKYDALTAAIKKRNKKAS